MIKRKFYVGVICVLLFGSYITYGQAAYVYFYAVPFFILYGGAVSLLADKIAEKWRPRFGSWLLSLVIHLLGGAAFALLFDPERTMIEVLLPFCITWVAVYWAVSYFFFTPRSSQKTEQD